MEKRENYSMHPKAKQNTEEALSYLIVQAHNKARELDELGENVIKHAQMELYVANVENVEDGALSLTAQKLKGNPDLKLKNSFKGILSYQANGHEIPSYEDENRVVFIDHDDETMETTQEVEDCTNNATITPVVATKSSPISIKSKLQKPVLIIDSFKVYPADTSKLKSKKFRASTLKCARELIKIIVESATSAALSELILKSNTVANCADARATLDHYAVISAMYDAVVQGTNIDSMAVKPLSDVSEKVAQLDNLAYNIVLNAEEFRADNEKTLDSPKLTAKNIKQYYSALGERESTKDEKVTGQQVIQNELSPIVSQIMAR